VKADVDEVDGSASQGDKVIELIFDTSSLENQLASLASNQILITITFVIVAGVVSLLLANRISKPISSLTRSVGQIAGGNLEINIDKDKSSKELLNLSSGILKMKDSIREKINDIETINTSYERFVPKEFLTLLKKDTIIDVNIGDSTSLKMGVLFSDMRNFTGMSEKMSPEENFNFLNRYLEFMTPAIKKHNGFIDKYIGDAVMALFPTSAEDAVLAAVEMNKQLAIYNSEEPVSGQDPVNMGIGIHIGQLVLGTIGRETRMETTVISDTVNASARLESLNKTYKTNVLISGAVRDELSPNIQRSCRLIDRTQVKGKVEFLDVYEVYLTDDAAVAEAKSKSKKVLTSIVDSYYRGEIKIAKKKLGGLEDETKKDTVISFWKNRLKT
jgi:class 3 adenylate cyclase/HAMP domain-containing protein